MLLSALVEFAGGDAELNFGDEVLGMHLKYLIHRVRIQAGPDARRGHVPFEAAPLAEGDRGDTVLVGEPQRIYDLVLALRGGDDIRG